MGKDLVLQVASLHLKDLSRLLPRLHLLQITDISELDEFAALFVEVDSGSAHQESEVPPSSIIRVVLINNIGQHYVLLRLILKSVTILLLKYFL